MGLATNLTKKSTSLFILNERNLSLLQKRVILFSGIPQEDIKMVYLKVGESEGQRIDMCTTILGMKHIDSKPILVFLHGYAASAVLYYKMYKKLLERFTIICVDHVGMGASTRAKNYNADTITPQESIDYFVGYIEQWRK